MLVLETNLDLKENNGIRVYSQLSLKRTSSAPASTVRPHTVVKRSACAQLLCNSRQHFPYKVLNFPKTFTLKPKVNAVPGKLRFICRLWIGNLIIHLN